MKRVSPVFFATLMVLSLACVACEDETSTTIANWRAEGDATDSIGPHDGTLLNGTTFAQGRSGQAFLFDGMEARVEVPDNQALDFTSGFTIQAWIKPSALPEEDHDAAAILAKFHSSGGGPTYGLFIRASGRLLVQVYTTDVGVFGTSSTSVVPTDTWTHVAGSYDGETLRLYVNGIEDSSLLNVFGDPALETSEEPLVIGYSAGNWATGFEGAIDEIELHNQALLSADIEAAAQ